MTLRPILSVSLPLSTFEDAYSIFVYTCLYLLYSLKYEILDINFYKIIKGKKPFSKGQRAGNVLAPQTVP